MVRVGLTYEHLLAARCFAAPDVAGPSAPRGILFRDATGHVWNGCGTMPDRMQRAIDAGQSIEHFRVEQRK
ncbi:hypothetical protein GCM10009080_51950 [Cupriavidus pauculus]